MVFTGSINVSGTPQGISWHLASRELYHTDGTSIYILNEEGVQLRLFTPSGNGTITAMCIVGDIIYFNRNRGSTVFRYQITADGVTLLSSIQIASSVGLTIGGLARHENKIYVTTRTPFQVSRINLDGSKDTDFTSVPTSWQNSLGISDEFIFVGRDDRELLNDPFSNSVERWNRLGGSSGAVTAIQNPGDTIHGMDAVDGHLWFGQPGRIIRSDYTFVGGSELSVLENNLDVIADMELTDHASYDRVTVRDGVTLSLNKVVLRIGTYVQEGAGKIRVVATGEEGGPGAISVGGIGGVGSLNINGQIFGDSLGNPGTTARPGWDRNHNTFDEINSVFAYILNYNYVTFINEFDMLVGTMGSLGISTFNGGTGGDGGAANVFNTRDGPIVSRGGMGGMGGASASGTDGVQGGGKCGLIINTIQSGLTIDAKGSNGNVGNPGVNNPGLPGLPGEVTDGGLPGAPGNAGSNSSLRGSNGSDGGQGGIVYLIYNKIVGELDVDVTGGDGGFKGSSHPSLQPPILEEDGVMGPSGYSLVLQYKTLITNVPITESVQSVRSLARSIATNLNITERTTSAINKFKSLVDNIPIFELRQKIRGVSRSISTNLPVFDVTGIGKEINRSVSTPLPLLEVRNIGKVLHRSISNALPLSEVRNIGKGINRSISTILGMSETTQRQSGIARSVLEVLALTEAFSNRVVQTVRVIIENLPIQEVIPETSKEINRSISTTLPISEFNVRMGILYKSVAEELRISSVVGSAIMIAKSVTENFKIAEAHAFSVIYTVEKFVTDVIPMGELVSYFKDIDGSKLDKLRIGLGGVRNTINLKSVRDKVNI